jgi:MoaA/NifB/PqqE/SkfB family radical SAM enzyme
MRIARSLFNSLLSLSSERLADLSPSAAGDAYRLIGAFAAFAGRPLMERLDPRVLNGAMSLLCDALARTPYGSQLEFEHPLIISLSTSSYCPFACSNCYASSGGNRERGRTSDRLQLFAKVAQSKTPFVILSGGEPLVADRFEECLGILLNAGKFVFVSTNALVDPSLAQQRDGQLVFILPVWGDRQRHDAGRGAHSFDRLERNLSVLNGVGQKPNLHIILDNDFSAFQDVERLVREHRVNVVTIARRIQTGRIDGTRRVLSAGDLIELDRWRAVLQRHARRVVCDLPELQPAAGLGRMHSLLGLPNFDGCAAGNWMMHIDDTGQGFPCFSFEGRQQLAVPRHLTIGDQWRAVRQMRAEFPAGVQCPGEYHARLEEAV